MINLNFFSHGATLEALRCVQESIRFSCKFCPEATDKELNAAMHDIARASRRIFEAYLRDQQRSLEGMAKGTPPQVVA